MLRASVTQSLALLVLFDRLFQCVSPHLCLTIAAMAELMESLYAKTGNDRFDAAFHRLVATPNDKPK
eukprot:COSAG02_NODE_5564_length_4225_cov_7.667071_2_plen_67_part_00